MEKELEAVLRVLAENFGTTVVHLWEVMVRQSLLQGLVSSAVSAAAIVFVFIMKNKIYRACEIQEERLMVQGISYILIFFGIIVLGQSIIQAINPEFNALQTILRSLN